MDGANKIKHFYWSNDYHWYWDHCCRIILSRCNMIVILQSLKEEIENVWKRCGYELSDNELFAIMEEIENENRQ